MAFHRQQHSRCWRLTASHPHCAPHLVPLSPPCAEAALAALGLPAGVERLILKTENTARDLMGRTAFTPDYTALDSSGAAWLVEHTAVRTLGIDYLSIGMLEDISQPHKTLFTKVCAGWCTSRFGLGALGVWDAEWRLLRVYAQGRQATKRPARPAPPYSMTKLFSSWMLACLNHDTPFNAYLHAGHHRN